MQAFGPNGSLASICGDTWGSDLAPLLVPVIAKSLGAVCLPRVLTRGSDGRVQCKVFWDLPPAELAPDGTPRRCSERPYLSQASETSGTPGGQRCEVAQAAIASDADLAAADPSAGWYYDDFSDDVRKACWLVKAHIAFTEFARPPSGVTVALDCFALRISSVQDAGTPEPAAACNVGGPAGATWPNLSSIGSRCTPAEIPERGYDDREVWIETGAQDCGTGVCMVYKLRGDPRQSCVPTSFRPTVAYPTGTVCADPEQVANRVYCSCRCAAPDPAAPTCACPQGFSCLPALAQGGAAFAGSYCVKDEN